MAKTTKRTELKKLILCIDGKDITLSIDAARSLHLALADLFGGQTATAWYPIYIDRYITPRPPFFYIYRSNNTACEISVPTKDAGALCCSWSSGGES